MIRREPSTRPARASLIRSAWRVALSLTAAMALTTGDAVAQLELTPFVGYRVFGSLTDWTGTNINADDAMSVGGLIGFMTAPSTRIEFGYSRQDTDVVLSEPWQGSSQYDVKIDHWTLGGMQDLGLSQTAVRPFATGYLGLSNMMSSDGSGSVQKFMIGAGIGARTAGTSMPVGLRFEARGYFAFAGSGGASVACGIGGCGFGYGGQSFFQMDLLAGIALRLGQAR